MPFNWKLGLVLTSFLIGEYYSESPDFITPYDGKLVGLCDKQKHEIITPQFSQIDYVGNGIFRAWTKNPESNLEHGTERILFNYNGQKLEVKVPAEGKFVNVFWLGKMADENPDLILNTLPGETLLRFAQGNFYGLCDTNGKVVLPAKYSLIGIATEGFAFVREPPAQEATEEKVYIFNCARNKLKELPTDKTLAILPSNFSDGVAAYCLSSKLNGDVHSGYINGSGTWVIKPRFSQAGNFRKGMAAVSTAPSAQEQPYSVAINKAGQIVSPPNMEVHDFVGDYAVARNIMDKPARYGVVNRQFKFVIKPQYLMLHPYHTIEYSSTLRPFASDATAPDFYLAQEDNSQQQKAISLTGEALSQPPREAAFTSSEKLVLPQLSTPQNNAASDSTTLSNPSPHVLTARQYQVRYRPITPERLLKEITLDDGKFDPVYWKKGHYRPFSRIAMFGRFLKDYDLIGMPREKVTRLLGNNRSRDNDSLSYWLDIGCIMDELHHLEIHFKDEKVESWGIAQWGKPAELITTNVILDLPASPYGAFESLPPRTKPK